jgi:hypothetical protein
MRELIERDVFSYMELQLDENKEQLEFALDCDLGYWNADEGPKLTKKFCKKLVKELTDDELFELLIYSYTVK